MNWKLLRIKVKQKRMTSVKEAHKVSDLDVFKIMSEFCLYSDTSNSGLEI